FWKDVTAVTTLIMDNSLTNTAGPSFAPCLARTYEKSILACLSFSFWRSMTSLGVSQGNTGRHFKEASK
ncbi:hypothetical protein PMAYCL1PPCAC_05934, partial [Pristionchus mayeri]